MAGRKILIAFFLVAVFLATEGRKSKKLRAQRERTYNMMFADDPLTSVTAVFPRSKIGECQCECCEPQLDELVAPCMNDVIVAVDSSACFRDHHRRMIQFLEKLVQEFHRSDEGQFGIDHTRMGIMQFSSDIVHAVELSDFDNYQTPSSSKRLRDEIKNRIRRLEFLGEGAYLNKALNATVDAFRRHPRPRRPEGVEPRKVVILLTNGNSHPNVLPEDIDDSIGLLEQEGVMVYPVSVTRRCLGITSPEWDEGLCPDTRVMDLLAKVGEKKETEFQAMRSSSTTGDLVNSVTDCGPYGEPPGRQESYCNNCTCKCDLPIGPKGDEGNKGDKGDFVEGPIGIPGIPGENGRIGDKGDVGPVGAKGEPGVIGFTGEKGDKGGVGEVGPRGPEGDVGARGERGPKGDVGPEGDIGERGPQGPKGEIGIPGLRGPRGEEGPPGEKGDYGEKGDEGDIGPPGLSIKGDEGPDGPPGPKGMNGPPGVRGPNGDPGKRGLCGKPGPAGVPGPAGLSGLDGVDGSAGPQGLQGPRGPPGIQGGRGLRGQEGREGEPGPPGPMGPTGARGPEGDVGPSGADGKDSTVAGPRGEPGQPGDKGSQGPRGGDGINGFQGPPGEQGPRGPVGQKGEEGVINFEALRPMIVDLIRDLMPGECGVDDDEDEPLPPNGDDRTAKCANSMTDIAFVIDGSSSVGDMDFELLRHFLEDFVESFENIEEEGFRVSIIQYNESPRIELSFEESVSQSAVMDVIHKLTYIEGNTQTGLALETARRIFNDIRVPGIREGASQVVVVITDGRSQDDVIEPAYSLKQDGVSIFAVGVTDSSDVIELLEIASSNEHVYNVENYSQIVGIKEDLLKKICKSVQGRYRGPRGDSDDEDFGPEGSGELNFDVYA